MGMGDKKIPYVPHYESILCDVTLRRFNTRMVRQCPEPHVKARYGTGGVVNVCLYVCKKCLHGIKYKDHGGIGCGLEQGIQAGTEDKLG